MAKLTGSQLVEYVRENSGLPEKELAVGAGYFTTLADGSQQVNTKPFYQALTLASGLVEPSTLGKNSSRLGGGRRLSYNVKTNDNSGNAVITAGYIRQIGGEPGDRLTIEVSREAGEIILKLDNENRNEFLEESTSEMEEEAVSLV